ncbi:hypothetical protein NQ317_010634 [Molorchus minor]|uniref:FAM234A/B beta-propeller domain-containing protein n=1 Tax=Molorchus minor TaxID=1323400 RepID=A0ABQ9JD37_9CUCU|nr:hypothetical protein NQ317_010634 [Molorchus minor]
MMDKTPGVQQTLPSMATYPGMSLRGEVRESISLDEDDLSDVEDEVFIRDGKNGYKLAEELNVKRPLMAPRRKHGKPDLGSRLKNKPPCRAFCRPCCYILAALTVLIGLIILVVILVSMYPLPLDRLRDWIIRKSTKEQSRLKLLPCSNVFITEVWSMNLPILTTDSPVRTLDVNGDGMEDILFGFGTGDNSNVLPPGTFCPMFMGVPPPCEGGVIALNGANGDIIWRNWLNDSIFGLHCTADINGDAQNDCLAVGVAGTIIMINTKNGSTIWRKNTGKLNVYVANFIPDHDNDSISDILASHSSLNDQSSGHIILISGRNGQEIRSIEMPNGAKTFYMPQILFKNNSSFVLFGTGTPSAGGNLSSVPLNDIVSGILSNETKVLYTDKYKGMLTQSVLVDITGDSIPDIVTAMYNSTVVAIDGKTFEQIWNYTVTGPKSETNVVPTPGYFNLDNVTDFLVMYQKYDDILNYNYTQTFVIDGKTGESIYSPISGSLITQMGGMTLSMDSYGYDMFLFWTGNALPLICLKKVQVPKVSVNSNGFYDECRIRFNMTRFLRLNAMDQFAQPPGYAFTTHVISHVNEEFNNTKSTMKRVREYYLSHPKFQIDPPGQTELDENYNLKPVPISIKKYGASSFRHKDARTGIIKDYMAPPAANSQAVDQDPQIDQDYDWPQGQNMMGNLDEMESEFNYPIDDTIPYNQKRLLIDENHLSNNRDPRSKEKKMSSSKMPENEQVKNEKPTSSKKKNLSDKKYGVYDYKNIRLARNRLLHDVNNLPTDILKDTFLKNRETWLRKSKFEQRDVNSHKEKSNDDDEVQKVLEEGREALQQNHSLSLWDLESEKEMQDWESGSYRGKRDASYNLESVTKITSVGAILNQPKNLTNNTASIDNTVDIVFITYWQPGILEEEDMLRRDIQDCINDKTEQKSEGTPKPWLSENHRQRTKSPVQKGVSGGTGQPETDFPHFNQLHQLRLGQMTVYRLRIKCECRAADKNREVRQVFTERSAKLACIFGEVRRWGIFHQGRLKFRCGLGNFGQSITIHNKAYQNGSPSNVSRSTLCLLIDYPSSVQGSN